MKKIRIDIGYCIARTGLWIFETYTGLKLEPETLDAIWPFLPIGPKFGVRWMQLGLLISGVKNA